MLARLLELHVAVIGNDDPKFLLHQIVPKSYQLDFEISRSQYSSLSDISLGRLAFEKKVFPSKTDY